MNFLKLSLILMLAFTITACGDDDEGSDNSCVQSDWVGTYTGTETCDGDIYDVTVNVTASGTDAIVIAITESDSTGTTTLTYDPIVPTGCTLSESGMDQGFTLSLIANLDEDVVTVSSTIGNGTVSETCIATATRN